MRFSCFDLPKVVCLGFALSAFVIGGLTLFDVSAYGFPDGHLTEFQRAASFPLSVLSWLLLGVSSVFSGFCLRSRKLGGILALLFLVVLVLLVLATLVGVPWYFGSHLGLENGVGG